MKKYNELTNDLTLVDFYATWCGPCRMLSPVLEEVTEIDVIKVDVDEERELSLQYKINQDPRQKQFLRENSYWYKYLNRSESYYKDFINDLKDKSKEVHKEIIKRLYERDKNQTCVMIWSLGNESSYGKMFYDGVDYIKARDSRPVHYEGIFTIAETDEYYTDRIDIASRMYASPQFFDEFLLN